MGLGISASSAARLQVALLAGLLFTDQLLAQTPAPAPGRVIGRSGTDLTAYATAPACAPRVAVTIVGKDPKLFEGGVSPAARFFGGVRAGHTLSCPQMTRMVARGLYNNRIMFSAMSDRSNDWDAVILGSTMLDAATEERIGQTSGPSDQSVLVKNPAFVDAELVLKRADAQPYMCINRSASGCEVITQFDRRSGKLVVTSRYRAGSGDTQAVVATPSAVQGGLICGESTQSTVTVEDARLTKEAKADLVEQIAERVHQNGRVCTGFQGKAGEAMTMLAFGPTGRKLRNGSPAVQLASRPALAVPQ